jgi:hypothetical protein
MRVRKQMKVRMPTAIGASVMIFIVAMMIASLTIKKPEIRMPAHEPQATVAASVTAETTQTPSTSEPQEETPDVPPPKTYPDAELEMLAKTVWGEARGCAADEQRLVIWTVFQRVDSGLFPDTLSAVIAQPNQFVGYDEKHPVSAEIAALCYEEYDKWQDGECPPTFAPYAKTTPYLFFEGDGWHNWYREDW